MLDPNAVPAPLREVVRETWNRLEGHLGPDALDLIRVACAREPVRTALTRVLAVSEYVASVARSQPAWFADFVAAETGYRAPDPDLIGDSLDAVDDVDSLKRELRRLRARVMVHIVWREVLGLADFDETVASVTRLAEQCIEAALSHLHAWAVLRDGTPRGGDSGAPQRLTVLALGKLGAAELNLSSDVDLVFAYPESGETDSGARSNQQFFVRLGQRLVQVLDDVTPDGFVFRVDMRLRPYGDAGALALHFDALELYFQEQGRDWERYAWIRARPCAGDIGAGARLVENLRPFVFRRYLDFGAVQSLREMKSRIDAERNRDSMRDDIKLGPGGIREVEFVVQMLQLIWAGREPELKHTHMRELLQALVALRLMDEPQARALGEAYLFLRNAEHKIQAIRDEQTQRLPASAVDRARLAFSMGFDDWPAFVAALDGHRHRVAKAFESLIGPEPAPTDTAAPFEALWRESDEAQVAAELARRGFGDAAALEHEVHRLRLARDRPWVGGEGRRRFDTLLPKLLAEMAMGSRPGETFARLTPLFEAVMRRSSYFALLLENPSARTLLVELCGESRWIATELAAHPMLLDELLDPALLYTVADRAALEADLARRLANVTELERQIDVLRNFKETHQFRVAACELRGILPLMKISDYLTYLAEVILNVSLDIAWRLTAEGQPERLASRPFLVVGYGKLGGLELGPGSDLDLVFLHDLPDEDARFLQRMVRRLLHILTARTQSGALYEVDTRLRPSGRRGTMVSSMAGFERYQREDAWVWEHQALVRARVVAGDPRLAVEFERIRRAIVCSPRERSELKAKILDMRQRIEDAAGEGVDVKRQPGGIVDIEFMVQYLALAWAASFPSLADWTDNVRILETAAKVGLLTNEVAEGLKDAYLALRAEAHRTALDLPDDVRAREVLERYRAFVREQWRLIVEE